MSLLPKTPAERSRRALLQGSPQRAAQALTSIATPVPRTAANADKLRGLHPHPSAPVTPTPRGALPRACKFTEAEVRRELRRLPYHSSLGPGGLRPGILKVLAYLPGGAEPTRSALTWLAAFLNCLVDGNAPPASNDYLAGATLIGLPKDDECRNVRPVAIGLAIRRLAGRLIMTRIRNDSLLASHLQPLQLGVGV